MEDDRDSGEVQADRFLGSLIFGTVLVTALGLIATGVFAQESKSLAFAGISIAIADTIGLIVWRIHAPPFNHTWTAIYFAGVAFMAFAIHALLSVLFGT